MSFLKKISFIFLGATIFAPQLFGMSTVNKIKNIAVDTVTDAVMTPVLCSIATSLNQHEFDGCPNELNMRRFGNVVDAARRGAISRARILLALGVCSAEEKSLALREAIRAKDMNLVRLLAQYNVDPLRTFNLYGGMDNSYKQATYLDDDRFAQFLDIFSPSSHVLEGLRRIVGLNQEQKKIIETFLQPTLAGAAKLYLEHNVQNTLLKELQKYNTMRADLQAVIPVTDLSKIVLDYCDDISTVSTETLRLMSYKARHDGHDEILAEVEKALRLS